MVKLISEYEESGMGPIPNTWREQIPWLFSPFRIFLLVAHSLALLTSIGVSFILWKWSSGPAPLLGILPGLLLLWVIERMREGDTSEHILREYRVRIKYDRK